MELPSKEEIKNHVLKELEDRKVPRMCENCITYERGVCKKTGKPMARFMFCPTHEFETEHLEKVATENLKAQAQECEKIENLLAMMLTCAGMTICVSEDFEKRTRRMYEKEKDKRVRLLLRKDLNVAEDTIKAYKEILEHLRKIEQQYNFYVFPHERKALAMDGKFSIKKTDGHLSNQFELLRVLMKIVKKVLGNKEQFDSLLEFIDSLEDSPYYALTDADIEHYRLKE